MRAFQEMTMREITKFKWVAKANANDIVHTQMQPSVRYTRDDVMELPETTYVDRDVVLDKEGQRAYDLLFNRMRMATGNGSTITAVNEAVLQNKLLQVACGFIYTDDRTVYSLPCKARMAALDEVIEETDRKVIVFAPFVAAVDGIVEHLRTGGHSVAHVYGATPRHVRDNVFRAFQSSASDPRILVAHPQTMAHGLTLTEANTIVWYGPTNSLEIYEQANARITRPGQKHKTLIVHLGGTKVEKATYQRLRRKSKMQGILLQMFKDQEVDY
jgi:SNF2 family DNA or RNA helicase